MASKAAMEVGRRIVAAGHCRSAHASKVLGLDMEHDEADEAVTQDLAELIDAHPMVTKLLRGGLEHRIGKNCPHCESEPAWQHKSWCPETDWQPQVEKEGT